MTIEAKHIEQAGDSCLGPAYFASRDIVDEYMKNMNDDSVKDLAKEYADKVYDQVLKTFEAFLLSDASLNLQGRLYQMVDGCVSALLGGDQWALNKYVLAPYNCLEIRAAVAKHIPQEIMEQRLIDLTKENEQLKESLKWARESRGF